MHDKWSWPSSEGDGELLEIVVKKILKTGIQLKGSEVETVGEKTRILNRMDNSPIKCVYNKSSSRSRKHKWHKFILKR